jgi:hypothetical protein
MNRPSIAILVMLPLLVAACGEVVPPLNAEQKARYVRETLEAGEACEAFRQRLAGPSPTMAAVDAIYDEARRAGCVKRDI